MKRVLCGSCGGVLRSILNLGTSPVANSFSDSPDDSERAERYPLGMDQCEDCGLCQISHVVPDEQLWTGDGFGYYSSSSLPLHTHFKQYADYIFKNLGISSHLPVIEVGCNDGLLLQHFAEANYTTLGIDPAAGPARVARERGLRVINEGLTLKLARELRQEIGGAGLVMANNVLAHVADLPDFLKALRELLDPSGYLIAEVQDFRQLAMRHGFDMLYHEHRFFYDQHTLTDVLIRAGFRVNQIMSVETQGGSLRVIAQPAEARTPSGRPIRSNALADDLQLRADTASMLLRKAIHELLFENKTIALYGAPAKATTLLHWARIDAALSYAVDTTPAKIGKFMPGTRIPIVERHGEGPDPDVFLVASWNYLPAIVRQELDFLRNGGRLLLPLPVPTLI